MAYYGSLPTYLQASATHSDVSVDMASSWLSDCLASHECSKPDGNGSWAPTRLVDTKATPPRLVLSTALQHPVQWLTLSHCWGRTKQCRLLSSNMQDFFVSLPLDELSRTFHDALTITRRLGMRYIWIDSLCIIQDDSADWENEAAMMSKVYSLSQCTISASHAADGSGGCFSTRDPRTILPVVIPSPFDRGPSAQPYLLHAKSIEDKWKTNVAEGPLYSRAWVVQERLLSPRTLYFGRDQVLFGCGQTEVCESFPRGGPPQAADIWWQFVGDRRRFRRLLQSPEFETTPYGRQWSEVIEMYALTGITYPTDRQIAFSGLTTELQTRRKASHAHGLWLDEAMPWSLLWSLQKRIPTRPTEWLAPTWSWLSLNAPIHSFNPYGSGDGRSSVLSVCEISPPPRAKQPGVSTSAGLVIRGSLKTAWYDPSATSPLFFRYHAIEESIMHSKDGGDNSGIADVIVSKLQGAFRPHSEDNADLGSPQPLSGGFDVEDYVPSSNVLICLPLVDMKTRPPRVAGLILEPLPAPPQVLVPGSDAWPVFRRAGYYHQIHGVQWAGGTGEITLVLI